MMASQGGDRNEKVYVIRGYHTCKHVQTPLIAELALEAEVRNEHNHVVPVMKDGYVVGYIPYSIGNIPVHVHVERCHALHWPSIY